MADQPNRACRQSPATPTCSGKAPGAWGFAGRAGPAFGMTAAPTTKSCGGVSGALA